MDITCAGNDVILNVTDYGILPLSDHPNYDEDIKNSDLVKALPGDYPLWGLCNLKDIRKYRFYEDLNIFQCDNELHDANEQDYKEKFKEYIKSAIG